MSTFENLHPLRKKKSSFLKSRHQKSTTCKNRKVRLIDFFDRLFYEHSAQGGCTFLGMVLHKEHPLSIEALQRLLRLIDEAQRKRKVKWLLFRQSKVKKYRVIGRRANRVRNRAEILVKIANMDNSFFKKYFRMSRESFEVLEKLIENDVRKDEMKARNSSKYPVSPALKLCLAL